MHILHVSDLHVTKPHRTLEQVWNGPHGALGGDTFDYIIVSGDLSQRATPAQYDELHGFVTQTLVRRLTLRSGEPTPDLGRIVFVPGNHDVDWSADVYDPVRVSGIKDDSFTELRADVAALRAEPETGDVRMFISDVGHFELLRIKRSAYPQRFANVQAFLDRVYLDAGGKHALARPRCRPFALLDPSGDGDWSAHVFPGDNVAFVGLSSCARNDRYWHGARFDDRAIASARAHIEELRGKYPGMLFVAVWHHGFASEVGRPDRLTLNDIGTLYNLGVRLGFHGHTHIDELEYHDLLSERLVIVATGSIGAGDGDLPRGTNNQFSVVDVYPSRVDIKRYELTRKNVYLATAESLWLARAPARTAVGPSRAARHRRTFRVNKDGIAEVIVELSGVEASGSLPLAIVSPPFCSVAHQPAATNHGQIEVQRTPLPDGRVRFWLAEAAGVNSCRWSYYVSNTVALTQPELAILPPRKPWYTNIGADEDARSHTVRINVDDLELCLKFEDGVPPIASARPLVERRQLDGQDGYWEVDELETQRAASDFRVDAGRREIVLRVPAPIAEHRYSIVFKPGDGAAPYPLRGAQIGRRIVELCRNEHQRACRLRDQLTDAVGRVLANVLKPEGSLGAWTGFIWHSEKRRLLTAFGDFPVKGWASRFEAGTGVAGHAFRHNYSVGWVRPSDALDRREPGRENTIYQQLPDHYAGEPVRYEWVLTLPLWLEQTGPSIGVVGLARERSRTVVDHRLRALAEEISSARGEVSEASAALLKKLQHQVNAAFWITLAQADHEDLSDDLCAYAAERLAVLGKLALE